MGNPTGDHRCSHLSSAGRGAVCVHVAGVLLGLASLVPQLWGQTARPTQSDVEAAYLLNFGKFVQWPADERSQPLNICILGVDPFGGTLDRFVQHGTIDGRALAVVRLKTVSNAGSCSILYFSSSEAPHFEQDMSALALLPVMTVSDMPAFAARGGMIQFVVENDRVRFDVNLGAAQKSGLVLSSQLLKVAEHVVGSDSGKEQP